MEEKLEIKDMLEIIYKGKEEELDDKIKKINNELKSKTNQENEEIITQAIAQNPELQKALENQEENYSIKMATTIKEFYKQGIIDGITLMINVLEKTKDKNI